MNQELAAQLLRVYDHLKGCRGTWEAHWEEIAERVLPRQMGFTGQRSPGEKRMQKVYDSKPMIALERHGSIMDSILTPRQNRWHLLQSTNAELNKSFAVRQWFDVSNDILWNMRYVPSANFTGQNSERWTSLGAFGTGCVFVDFDEGEGVRQRGLRYRCISLRDLYVQENHQGLVDTVYRRFSWTPRQAAQKWGADNLPESLKKLLEDVVKQNEPCEFVHVVKPRDDYMPGRMDARGRPWASYYIYVKDKYMMEEGGYTSFPYSISRYMTAPDEVYGRSPAMSALPDIKMLNEMNKTDIRAAHKLVDPPLLMHDDGILGGAMNVDMRPGGLNPGGVNKDGRQLIQPFHTGARVDISEAKMEQRRAAIDSAFMMDLFQILVDTPRMTATEALIRAQEKGMLIAPTMGRQYSEAIGPQIERELDLLMFHGMIPPMPPELIEAQGEYDIVYDSPATRAQKAEELVGVQRTMELLTPFAQIAGPQVFDIIDPDKLAELTARVSGVPMSILRSDEEIQSVRAQRQSAEEAASMAQNAQPMAAAIKDVAQASAIAQGQ